MTPIASFYSLIVKTDACIVSLEIIITSAPVWPSMLRISINRFHMWVCYLLPGLPKSTSAAAAAAAAATFIQLLLQLLAPTYP